MDETGGNDDDDDDDSMGGLDETDSHLRRRYMNDGMCEVSDLDFRLICTTVQQTELEMVRKNSARQ